VASEEILSNESARRWVTGGDEEPWRAGEPLCGCDGIPCRTNKMTEDGVDVCGSCELPCHSVERVEEAP
jgi:hypothetical protein